LAFPLFALTLTIPPPLHSAQEPAAAPAGGVEDAEPFILVEFDLGPEK
jgi:hypothetical protein